MLQLTWFEFCVRTIPESFFLILAVHAFSKQTIDKKRYIIASVLLAIMIFFIRMLPISYGVHTIIVLIVLIALTNYINKIKLSRSIRSSIFTLILLYICELFSMFVYQNILQVDVEKMLNNVYSKTLFGLLSLVLLIVIAVLSYYLLVIRKRERNV